MDTIKLKYVGFRENSMKAPSSNRKSRELKRDKRVLNVVYLPTRHYYEIVDGVETVAKLLKGNKVNGITGKAEKNLQFLSNSDVKKLRHISRMRKRNKSNPLVIEVIQNVVEKTT